MNFNDGLPNSGLNYLTKAVKERWQTPNHVSIKPVAVDMK